MKRGLFLPSCALVPVAALELRPRLLLLDEPFGALDRELRERLADDVRAVLRASDTPGLHVTHDEDEAVRIGDRVLRLVPGEHGATLAPA
jgi:thiamine transport system ATP-binding protein